MLPLKFKDFVPQKKKADPGIYVQESENFQGAVNDFNTWVKKSKVNIIRVETVVLPNINNPREDGSTDSQLKTPDNFPSIWHQFLRCWYTDLPKESRRESGKIVQGQRRPTGKSSPPGALAKGRPSRPAQPSQKRPKKPKS